ncbi:MAG: DUF3662 domain-containing protein [Anaerolineae bacterium]|nr:DUF3662 domain-containing protein [Anaerolineae bacterium]
MSVEVWRFNRTGFGHENAALLYLARQLDALSEHFLIIANPVLGGHELDALIFKRDMIFVVEFKSANGPVTGDLYSPWMVKQADGTTLPLNEGRDDNPFWQVQHAYSAALDFLNANKTAFMTPSEIATTDFKKIKNVLIFDPEYSETASDIQLGKEAWKLKIVGLHNNVVDPFFTLRHEKINLTAEQMQMIARDILCCRLDEDMAQLLHPAEQTESTSSEDPTLSLPLEEAPDIYAEEVSGMPQADIGKPNPVEVLKQGWQALREQAVKGKEALRREQERWYAANPVDFEQLLDQLRQAADRSVHYLPPDTLVANVYMVRLIPSSFERLEQLLKQYETRLEAQLLDYFAQQGYRPAHRPVTVHIEKGDGSKQIVVTAKIQALPPTVRIEGPRGQSRDLYPGDTLTIGRGKTVDYRICDEEHPQPVISRQHCHISVSTDGKSVVVYDDESMNHTFLNGKQIVSASLNDGDILLLGRNKRDEEGPTLQVRMISK